MKKYNNLVLEMVSSFFAGNMILLGSYIIVYIVSKMEYEMAILNLVNFQNLILQLIGSGLVGCLYTLVVKYFIYKEKAFDIKSNKTKDMFKEAFKKCLKMAGIIIFSLGVVVLVLECILSKAMSEALTQSFIGAAAIAQLVWASGYVGIVLKNELNKKLEERKVRKYS